jgi:hypothetical protein
VGLTLAKMAGAVCILAFAVALMAVIAHFSVPGVEDRTPQARKSPPPVVYEVYPKTSSPAAKPRKSAPRPAPAPSASSPPVSETPKPPAKRPKVAIIIDDIGYDRHLAEAFMDMGAPMTFSILPESPFGSALARRMKAKGYELMLHLPMEPMEYPAVDPGPGALLSRMTPDELIAQLHRNLDAMPDAKGVNNHMGSRLTSEASRMYQIFTVLKRRNLFYVDSRSSAETVARPSARLFQLPFAERDVFLDHLQEPDFIRGQFRQLLQTAREEGEAVAIAHPHEVTVAVFREELPKLRRQVDLVPASEVVHVVE